MKSIARYISSSLDIAEQHQIASWLFLKILAIIYFSAFLSLAIQIPGLVGSNGILPFTELLDYAYEQQGYMAIAYMPTLFWLNASDYVLQAVAYCGCMFSIFLLFGYRSKTVLILLFIFYLSLFHAGQTFLTFQWDTLLLESGFLAIFLVSGPSRLVIFLYHWLLFRLRFMSGISKLTSGDPVWADLTTLKYYFETQPLPHVGAWYFHQLPDWLLQAGVIFTFFTELVVPFFIFLPRKFRVSAAIITIFMQLLIIATSNHNWINLLTIGLCLFVLDDGIIKKLMPGFLLPADIKPSSTDRKQSYVLPIFAFLILSSSVTAFINMNFARMPQKITQATGFVRALGIGHIFHVFPTMQTERHELQIEGSYDGKDWKAYQFKYKPGPVDKKPEFIIPHQPRLDWMIWFVPPQSPRFKYWFDQFIYRLQQGSPEVLDLLDYNPFPERPPLYIRVLAFQYNFTTTEEREKTGNWWKYEYLGLFPDVRPRAP